MNDKSLICITVEAPDIRWSFNARWWVNPNPGVCLNTYLCRYYHLCIALKSDRYLHQLFINRGVTPPTPKHHNKASRCTLIIERVTKATLFFFRQHEPAQNNTQTETTWGNVSICQPYYAK
jgi:hypothetical protein